MVLLKLFNNLRICGNIRYYSNTELGVQLKQWTIKPVEQPKQIWIENFNTPEEKKVGLLQLHPEIFCTMPRIDVIHQNIIWQRKYKNVSYNGCKVWHEIRGGGKKPWPQKGGGRARHGTIRSALFVGGEVIHGPRPFKTHFYMLPYFSRIMGLTSTLSIKLAQDDLHVIDHLEIPTADPKYIEDIVEKRNWGPSVLIVDDTDIMPQNISLATDTIGHVNLMPVYGLNVYSMLKHDTLVLTTAAVERIEEKLLEKLHTCNPLDYQKKFRINQQ